MKNTKITKFKFTTDDKKQTLFVRIELENKDKKDPCFSASGTNTEHHGNIGQFLKKIYNQ